MEMLLPKKQQNVAILIATHSFTLKVVSLVMKSLNFILWEWLLSHFLPVKPGQLGNLYKYSSSMYY